MSERTGYTTFDWEGLVAPPVATVPNPHYRTDLPESRYLCPVCGDGHVRGVAWSSGKAETIFICADGHHYRVLAEG